MRTESGLFSGWVWHRRYGPVTHEFHYPLYLLWLDLSRREEFLSRNPLWGTRTRPVTVRERDYLDGKPGCLDTRVRAKAGELGLDWREGTVMLLGQPRALGMLFNPLVLYWHFPPGQEQPDTLMAEVRNTPWKECHWYALFPAQDGCESRYRHPKAFHVSPFLDMAMDYHWRIRAGANRLGVVIENRRSEGALVFEAGMTLDRLAESSRPMRHFLVKGSWQALATRARIHWQAWKLWRKRVPVQPHPGKRST